MGKMDKDTRKKNQKSHNRWQDDTINDKFDEKVVIEKALSDLI